MEQVVEEGLTIETRFTGFDDYWGPFLEKQGPAGAYVATLPLGERQQLRERLRRRLLGDRSRSANPADGPGLGGARRRAVR